MERPEVPLIWKQSVKDKMLQLRNDILHNGKGDLRTTPCIRVDPFTGEILDCYESCQAAAIELFPNTHVSQVGPKAQNIRMSISNEERKAYGFFWYDFNHAQWLRLGERNIYQAPYPDDPVDQNEKNTISYDI